MSYYILVLSSVTYALKAQGILSRQGIWSKLERLKKEQSLHGCGYGLLVESSKLDASAALLKKERIKVIEVVDKNN